MLKTHVPARWSTNLLAMKWVGAPCGFATIGHLGPVRVDHGPENLRNKSPGRKGEYEAQMIHGAGIFTYIYPINDPNVGEYSIHGSSGLVRVCYR